MKTRRFPEFIPEDARTKPAGTSSSPENLYPHCRKAAGAHQQTESSSLPPGPVEQKKSSEGGKPHSPESLPHPHSCSGEPPNTGSTDMRLLRCCPNLPKLTLCTQLGVTLSSLAAFINTTLQENINSLSSLFPSVMQDT